MIMLTTPYENLKNQENAHAQWELVYTLKNKILLKERATEITVDILESSN